MANQNNLYTIIPHSYTLLAILGITAGLAFFALGIGHYAIAPERVLYILMNPFSCGPGTGYEVEHQVIWLVRMPRILMSLFAGGGLALCGAALQGVFYNPLVDPHIIGVTSGAAFGGTMAILYGFTPLGLLFSSFTFGLVALLLVYCIAALLQQRNNLILVLAGVLLNGFFSALVSLLQYVADTEEKLPNIVFWLMGSFATANWNKFVMLLIPCLIGGCLLMRLRWRINVLSLGDSEAKALGISAATTKWAILLLCALIISAQVATSGSIGWVGLIIPHLARFLTGSDHVRLLPVAFLMGGGFMIVVDILARMLTMAEIPLGIITAIIGGPLFIVLLVKKIQKG